MSDIVSVRTTHLNDYVGCPRRYYYRYLHDNSPTGVHIPFLYGGIGHYVLELILSGQVDTFDDALNHWFYNGAETREEAALGGQYFDEIKSVLIHHHMFWKWKDSDLSDFDILKVEHTFVRPMVGFTYRGTIDGLVRINGKLYLLEHKFVSSISRYMRSIANSLQPHVYLHYMRKDFPDLVGVLYNLVLKDPVSYPEPYKTKSKQGTYKLKGFNATEPMLQLWEAHHGKSFGPAVHSFVQTDKYEQQRFHRFIYAPDDNQMDIMMSFVDRQTMDFVDSHETGWFPRRINYHTCTFCPFRRECLGIRL